MSLSRFVVGTLWGGMLVVGAGMVSAQTYPNKPIRIVTVAAGSSADFVARQTGQGLTDSLGQPVIVENRPTIFAIETVAKAPPDGYTLLLVGSTTKYMAGVKIVGINHKGNDQATAALIRGDVQMSLAAVSNVAPHIKSGKLRALAISSLTPSALAPGLPTIAASGLPGYEAVSVNSLFAPAKIRSEMSSMGKVIKEAGIKGE